jgi:hypothetical protein
LIIDSVIIVSHQSENKMNRECYQMNDVDWTHWKNELNWKENRLIVIKSWEMWLLCVINNMFANLRLLLSLLFEVCVCVCVCVILFCFQFCVSNCVKRRETKRRDPFTQWVNTSHFMCWEERNETFSQFETK